MPLGVDYSVSHTSWRGGLKVSGGEEWGLLSGWETPNSLISFCSAARSSYIQALDTRTPECCGQWLGSPLQATLPSAVHGNAHSKASFRDGWKMVLSILWGQRSQDRSSEGNSTVVRRTWGSFLPESGGGGCCRGGSGEAEGDSRVSGGPPSSPTLGACGAGTCGRRSGSTSCTGTS